MLDIAYYLFIKYFKLIFRERVRKREREINIELEPNPLPGVEPHPGHVL